MPIRPQAGGCGEFDEYKYDDRSLRNAFTSIGETVDKRERDEERMRQDVERWQQRSNDYLEAIEFVNALGRLRHGSTFDVVQPNSRPNEEIQ